MRIHTPNNQPKSQQAPYAHQRWIIKHLVSLKTGDDVGSTSLGTPEGKPVVIHHISDPEVGERFNVSRGALGSGDQDFNRTVYVDPAPGANLPELGGGVKTAEVAQEVIDDLRRAN